MFRAVVTTLGVPLALAIACNPGRAPEAPNEPGAGAAEPAHPPISAEVHALMDETVDPCTDFYRFACGQWMDETEIPADESRFGRFNALRQHNEQALRTILEAAVAAPNPDADTERLAEFYRACMDEGATEEQGLKGLLPWMEVTAQIRDAGSLMGALAQLHRLGAQGLFSFDVGADYDQPDINIAHLSQGGLGLPDRDYYLREGAEADVLREAYVAHIRTMLAAAGNANPVDAAQRIMTFETALARASTPREALRDPQKRHNELSAAALGKLTPSLPWSAYFEALGAPMPATVNVSPEGYFRALSGLVQGAAAKRDRAPAMTTIRDYLQWQLIHAAAPHLPKAFADENFAFFDQRLRGQAEPTPRWRRCVLATDDALGESLAQGFVAEHFAGDAKAIALTMIHAIEEAFASGLPELAWMDDATRARAVEKMKSIVNKIGYPEAWRNYEALAVGPEHLANVAAAQRFEFDRHLGELGKPVDKKEWHMTPPTVNAYYNPSNNEMVFPAGILQRPFFDAEYPMAMNFGGIGMVMGHELTHGFDDQGRKYDGRGRLTEWWDGSAVAAFEERAQCVSDLYDTYEVQPGVHLNGKLTLGENIADFGGIKDAFRAYSAYAAKQGPTDPAVAELTDAQLFFVSFGQIWCSKATPEAERVLALTDPHANARYRVNGPLSHLPEFWETFSCEPGEPMRPPNTCEVW